METEFQPINNSFKVLVVDDDPVCLREYRDALSNLGYVVDCAASASDALKQIAESHDIGVVITDIEMPTMDGISLLSEIANRFSSNRPIVTLVITGNSNLEVATQAMQSQATDILCKPVTQGGLVEALRRASTNYFKIASRFQITSLTNRLNSATPADETPDRAPTDVELQSFVQMLLKSQYNKSKYFDAAVFVGPSWEIFLDIAEASLRGEAIAASSAAASSFVSLSTAMRHVNNLVEAGLVQSWTDPADKRRTLLKLEPHALETMQRYLRAVWKLHADIRPAA